VFKTAWKRSIFWGKKEEKKLSKTSFLRIHFNIICLSTRNIHVGLWHSGFSSKTLSPPCISHSQSFISLWRRGAKCLI
jgi:hypothetical protein